MIHLEDTGERLAEFRDRLERELPPAAEIHAITVEEEPGENCAGFTILPSEQLEESPRPGTAPPIRVLITPDLAVCPACLGEFDSRDDRRVGFALSGCTDCGPRFSIQTSAPFDRERTTMVDFPPCPQCLREYTDPADRRFHAQNIACPQCGPRIHLEKKGDPVVPSSSGSANPGSTDFPVLEQAARLLRDGQILAVKGVGGFHLICDATSAQAVPHAPRAEATRS